MATDISPDGIPQSTVGPRGPGDDVSRQTLLIALSTVVVSVANYAFALVVIRFLSPADYVHYASVQSLLLVLGTGCMAAIPWAIAQYLARMGTLRAQAAALRFGLLASGAQGLVFAGASLLFVGPYAGWSLASCTAVAALAMSLVAAPLGVLQGTQRIRSIAGLRLIETAVRVGASMLLLLLVAASPESPVIGFAAGSVVLLAVGLLLCRRAWSTSRAPAGVFEGLLRRSAGFAVLQIAVAGVGAVDTVVITYTALSDYDASAYQVTALAGRIPLFLSAAVTLSWFQRIAAAPDERGARLGLRGALRQYLLLATPAALCVMAAPPLLLDLLSPDRGDELWSLTPWTAALGWGVGVLTLLITEHQARSRVRRAIVLLLPVAVAQPFVLVLAGRVGGVTTFAAAGVLAVIVLLVLFLSDLGLGWLRGCLWRGEALSLTAGGILAVAARFEPLIWPAAVLVLTHAVMSSVGGRRRLLRSSRETPGS